MHDHPYEAIINTAKDKGCELICMASHGRKGMSALVLGSETVKVLTHSNIRLSFAADTLDRPSFSVVLERVLQYKPSIRLGPGWSVTAGSAPAGRAGLNMRTESSLPPGFTPRLIGFCALCSRPAACGLLLVG